MTARSYITERGIPVAVEVGADADRIEVERELRRIYGNAYRLGRFVRRGKRQRASVEKSNISDVFTRRVHVNGGWLGGVP